MRSTHTYVIAEVSRSAFDEVHGLMKKAAYDHAIHEDRDHGTVIDMHGIALAAKPAASDVDPELLAVAAQANALGYTLVPTDRIKTLQALRFYSPAEFPEGAMREKLVHVLANAIAERLVEHEAALVQSADSRDPDSQDKIIAAKFQIIMPAGKPEKAEITE